jgi:hypothetical protein
MTLHRFMRFALLGGLVTTLTACGGGFSGFGSGGGTRDVAAVREAAQRNKDAEFEMRAAQDDIIVRPENGQSIWDIFSGGDDANVTVEVNKYIWKAALEVLDFLPVQAVDPFTGVIVTGYGTPPGGGRAYRATVYVQDPALDARSLKVALQSRGGGAVSRETARAVEDAILTRARQLRVQDSKL